MMIPHRRHLLRHRLNDALIGLLEGAMQIGGHDHHGLHDDPVVRTMCDAGYLAFDGRWCLTPAGIEMARCAAILRDAVEAVELAEPQA